MQNLLKNIRSAVFYLIKFQVKGLQLYWRDSCLCAFLRIREPQNSSTGNKFINSQKQPFPDILQNSCSLKFRINQRKTPVLVSLFRKVAGLNLETVPQKIWYWVMDFFDPFNRKHVPHLVQKHCYNFSFLTEKSSWNLSTRQIFAGLRDVLKTYLEETCLENKQSIYWGYLHLANLNVYLKNLYFRNLYLTKLRWIQIH